MGRGNQGSKYGSPFKKQIVFFFIIRKNGKVHLLFHETGIRIAKGLDCKGGSVSIN